MMERRIKDRTLSGKFHPSKSRGRYSSYEPDYAKKQGRQSPVTLTSARGSTGMLDGMTGKGSFTQMEMNIAMAFSTSRHQRIAQYHNDEGIRTKSGLKIRHFLYVSKTDVRAMIRVMADTLGITIKSK